MNILKEIKDFAVKGNFIDMSIGIVIGSAFSSIVDSLVSDIITPVIGLLTKGVDLTDIFIVLKRGTKGVKYSSLKQATFDGAVTLNIGQFCEKIIIFSIVAVTLFYVIKVVNKIRNSSEVITPEGTTKICPHCFTTIHLKASKCPNCTSAIDK